MEKCEHLLYSYLGIIFNLEEDNNGIAIVTKSESLYLTETESLSIIWYSNLGFASRQTQSEGTLDEDKGEIR